MDINRRCIHGPFRCASYKWIFESGVGDDSTGVLRMYHVCRV